MSMPLDSHQIFGCTCWCWAVHIGIGVIHANIGFSGLVVHDGVQLNTLVLRMSLKGVGKRFGCVAWTWLCHIWNSKSNSLSTSGFISDIGFYKWFFDWWWRDFYLTVRNLGFLPERVFLVRMIHGQVPYLVQRSELTCDVITLVLCTSYLIHFPSVSLSFFRKQKKT